MLEKPTVSRRELGVFAAVATVFTAVPAAAQPRRRPDRGDWFQMVRDHHAEIDTLLRQMETTRGPARRAEHLRRVATALTGHSIAEEVVLYPMIEILGVKRDSEALYDEQQDAKVLIARLDAMPKAGPEFLREFRAMADAVRAHVRHEEERSYPELQRRASPAQNAKMSDDFSREFHRYADGV